MSKYKTRSEKLLNTIQALEDEKEISIGELRKRVGSLEEAKSIASLLFDIGFANETTRINKETNRKSVILELSEDLGNLEDSWEAINAFIMGSREAIEYARVREYLSNSMKPKEKIIIESNTLNEGVGTGARLSPRQRMSRESDQVIVRTQKADPETAEKFVKDFLDVTDILDNQKTIKSEKEDDDK